MEDSAQLAATVVVAYLLAGALALVFSRYPRRGPDMDHPVRWRRGFNRVVAYAYANIVSCFATLVLVRLIWITYDYLGGPALPAVQRGTIWPLIIVLVGPIPLAVVVFNLLLRGQRRRSRNATRDLRRAGLLPQPTLRPGTPPTTPFRASNFEHLNLADDDVVRELARGHWQAINGALATNADVAPAHEAQKAFLDEFLPRLPTAEAERIRAVYSEDSGQQLKEMARIAKRKNEELASLLTRRQRYMRRYVVITLIACVLVLLRLLLPWLH